MERKKGGEIAPRGSRDAETQMALACFLQERWMLVVCVCVAGGGAIGVSSSGSYRQCLLARSVVEPGRENCCSDALPFPSLFFIDMMIVECEWDHKVVPYVPSRPCLLFYVVPEDPVPRVFLPNSRGEYFNLIPGLPYLEQRDYEASPLLEYAPPIISNDASLSVKWEDLPVPTRFQLSTFQKNS